MKKVWVTGHRGMLGSALVRKLSHDDNVELLLVDRVQLNLLDGIAVDNWISLNKPDLIFHIAAKVGGIGANLESPADFLSENLQTQLNVIKSAQKYSINKLIFVATNCIYSPNNGSLISEDDLYSGPTDLSVRAYGVGKMAGIELCRSYSRQYNVNYISVVPPNLYGPNDNYHPRVSHVMAALIRRAHEAQYCGLPELSIWGDGTASREFLYVDDLAEAMTQLMYSDVRHDVINIGYGSDVTIHDLAQLIASVVGYKGVLVFDKTKPSGASRKLLNSGRMNALGWSPKISLIEGIGLAYEDFKRRLEMGANERS